MDIEDKTYIYKQEVQEFWFKYGKKYDLSDRVLSDLNEILTTVAITTGFVLGKENDKQTKE